MSVNLRVVAITGGRMVGAHRWVGDVEWSDGLTRRVLRYPDDATGATLFQWWLQIGAGAGKRSALPVNRLDSLLDVLDDFVTHAQAVDAADLAVRDAKAAYLAALGEAVDALNNSGRRMVDRANEWVRVLNALAALKGAKAVAPRIAQVAKEIAAVRACAGDADAALHRAEQAVEQRQVEREALTVPPRVQARSEA